MDVVGASVIETEVEGRHLIASTDLVAGHTVYNGFAYATAIYDEFVQHVCACCFSIAHEPNAFAHHCRQCSRVFYCSDACRRMHREDGAPGVAPHRLVCPALQKFQAIEQMGSLIKARLIIEILAQQYHSPTAGGEEERADLARLVCHVPDSSWILDEESDAWLGGLRDAVAACAWAGHVPASELTDVALLSTVDKVDTNGFDCKMHETGGESIGIGLYLRGVTLLNHSCAPNCHISHRLPTLCVIAQRAVAAGEALTIAYVDVTADRADRRERLAADYAFECACARCVAEEAEEALHAGRQAEGPSSGDEHKGVLLRSALCMLTIGAVCTGYWALAAVGLLVYSWSLWRPSRAVAHPGERRIL